MLRPSPSPSFFLRVLMSFRPCMFGKIGKTIYEPAGRTQVDFGSEMEKEKENFLHDFAATVFFRLCLSHGHAKARAGSECLQFLELQSRLWRITNKRDTKRKRRAMVHCTVHLWKYRMAQMARGERGKGGGGKDRADPDRSRPLSLSQAHTHHTQTAAQSVDTCVHFPLIMSSLSFPAEYRSVTRPRWQNIIISLTHYKKTCAPSIGVIAQRERV